MRAPAWSPSKQGIAECEQRRSGSEEFMFVCISGWSTSKRKKCLLKVVKHTQVRANPTYVCPIVLSLGSGRPSRLRFTRAFVLIYMRRGCVRAGASRASTLLPACASARPRQGHALAFPLLFPARPFLPS